MFNIAQASHAKAVSKAQGPHVILEFLPDIEGQSDNNPIKIPQITAKEFEYIEAICWPQPPFPHDKLVAILKLATLYLMAPAQDWEIDWLTSEELHPKLAHQYNVDHLIEPAF
ncbi:hypothetical protein JB92DRAFT_2828061 [Gautieria morchelliformis]|nr:hypothetical protein JB92DRAFT_2828061 [Gautieria morchelliformis]